MKPRSLTPGRALRWLRWRVQNRLQPVNACRGVFGSFDEAARSAPPIKPIGYDEAGSTAWYQRKMEQVSLEDYPVLFWLRSAFETSDSVLELGGHLGVAYYGFATVLAYPPTLTWTICDVPTIAREGAALAAARGRSDLRFVTEPAEGDGAGILLACGALQYLDEPVGRTIERLRVRPRHVLINVTPVHDGPSFVTLQNIGSAYCPYRVFNRAELLGSLGALGYRVVDAWRKERALRIPGHPELSFDHYSGFYLRSSEA